jgi:hypothetical protein
VLKERAMANVNDKSDGLPEYKGLYCTVAPGARRLLSGLVEEEGRELPDVRSVLRELIPDIQRKPGTTSFGGLTFRSGEWLVLIAVHSKKRRPPVRVHAVTAEDVPGLPDGLRQAVEGYVKRIGGCERN